MKRVPWIYFWAYHWYIPCTQYSIVNSLCGKGACANLPACGPKRRQTYRRRWMTRVGCGTKWTETRKIVDDGSRHDKQTNTQTNTQKNKQRVRLFIITVVYCAARTNKKKKNNNDSAYVGRAAGVRTQRAMATTDCERTHGLWTLRCCCLLTELLLRRQASFFSRRSQ